MCRGDDLVRPNCSYVVGIFGLLSIGELLSAILVCACVSRGICHYVCTGLNFQLVGAEGQNFVLVVTSICIVSTSLFFLAHLVNLADWSENVRWAQVEFLFTSVAALLMFISAVTESWYAGGSRQSHAEYDHSAWVAAAVFAFILTGLYLVNAWRLWQLSTLGNSLGVCCAAKMVQTSP